MNLECNNCGYEWDYSGDSEYWATCPRCKSSVKVKNQENKDKDEN